MQKVFLSIYYFFKQRRALLFLTFFSSLLLSALLATRVRFEEDVYAIIPGDKKTDKLSQLFRDSKFADKLVVMVSLKDTVDINPGALVQYADEFSGKLQQKAPVYIKNIRYHIDESITWSLFETMQQHLPVFLTEQDYQKIDTLIQPGPLQKSLSRNSSLLTLPGASPLKNFILNDPSGISFIALQKLQQLQYEDNVALFQNHFITANKKTLLLFVTPAFPAGNTGKNKILFDVMDSIIASSGAKYKQVDVQYFGGAVVSQDNAAQLRKDTLLTQGITVLFIIIFLSLYFRKKRAPFLILVPVIYGVAFALACIALIKGSISVIALGMGSIVLGIAVNYSLHVFNHYRHTGSIVQVIKDLSFPLTIGSLTTILGFFSLQYAASDMLKDLGLFAGFSIVGAVLCSLMFLPHFIGKNHGVALQSSWIDSVSSIRFEHNKWLVLAIFGLTIVFYFFAKKVSFDEDASRLNYISEKLLAAEKKLSSISGASLKSIYLMSEGKNLEEALQKNEALQQPLDHLQARGIVSATSGVTNLYVSKALQQRRIERWNHYWTPEKKAQLMQRITALGLQQGFTRDGFANFYSLLYRKYTLPDTQSLAALRKSFLDDYITEKPGSVSVVTLAKVPELQRTKAINLIEKLSDVYVLDRQYLTNRLTQVVRSDFGRIAWMVSLIVAAVLLLTYGRIELMLVSFIPMLISWVWILGIMAMAGIRFNIVNIIISALIFGLGDDYSLFVMDGLLGEYKTGKKTLPSYKSSILISAIITITGLGVLLFAKHPALRSIAFISVTGIICVVLMSQILIPFFFSVVIKNRVARGFHPWTLWSWVRSVFSFFYFGLVSLLLTVAGLFLIKLKITGYKRGKKVYHFLLSKLCMSVLYIMGNFKKRVINEHHERFDQPAVVIANHQSFLDILQMAMLNPRLILLTNKWVWQSPVFGWAVKMADFYPVANGIESSVALLNQQVQQGYSIAVFPEGTRSAKPPIKRFHKGAFYLAEQLQLDIVPVLFHGLGYTMTRGDYLLKNGPITAKYLPRIKADNAYWGHTYQERTRSISKYFKKQHETLTEQLEQPVYFKEHLFFNYIYKGPVLEWYLKIKLKLENYYRPFHELLPKEGKILDLGCGYGFMSYILAWSSHGKRQITGVDYDEGKIATAQHCFSRTDDVQFICADAIQFKFEKYDGIVISDVLHYLLPQQQDAVIEKAIAALEPGGLLIIRDGDSDLKEKHKGTKLTEFFSTKLFVFNKTANDLHFLSDKKITEMAGRHALELERRDNTRFTSNVIWVMRKAKK